MSYEMEAVAVGHDLARGKAKFFRSRPTATDAATGPEADAVVRGEAAELAYFGAKVLHPLTLVRAKGALPVAGEPLIRRVLSIYEKTLGADALDFATAVNNRWSSDCAVVAASSALTCSTTGRTRLISRSARPNSGGLMKSSAEFTNMTGATMVPSAGSGS